MSPADINKTALTMAQRDVNANLSLMGKPAAVRDAEIDRLTKKYSQQLQEGVGSGASAPAAPAPAAAPSATLRPVDQQALEWANANPADPRSAEIKRRLGVK